MIDQDVRAELTLVFVALEALNRKNKNWQSNINVLDSMNDYRAMCWWRHVQKQVDLGLLSMQPLVLEVIKQKLIG